MRANTLLIIIVVAMVWYSDYTGLISLGVDLDHPIAVKILELYRTYSNSINT